MLRRRHRLLLALCAFRTLLAICLATSLVAPAPAQASPAAPRAGVFYITPYIEGLSMCDEGALNPRIRRFEDARRWCDSRGLNAAAAVRRALEALEPGGPQGQVQVGYEAVLPLLGLYRRQGSAWVIDERKVNAYLNLIAQVDRPVVVYLAADHFDSQGPLVDALLKDRRNLMQLADGTVPMGGYFGYRIVPYTLQTDESLPVNRYRFAALRHVARKLAALPPQVQRRIVAVSMAGEVHHMFPDFEAGMGRYERVRVTDYSPASVAGFREWLAARYPSPQALASALGPAARPGFSRWSEVPAPGRDIRQTPGRPLTEHYDAYAHGRLPVAGWLWDPQGQVRALDLYLDGQRVGPMARGLNRLDVYRALDAVTHPNVGFRRDLDFSRLPPGRHLAQVVAETPGARVLLGQAEFTVGTAPAKHAQARADSGSPAAPAGLTGLRAASTLAGVQSWLDMPGTPPVLYYNPLAHEWNLYREAQVNRFLTHFHAVAVEAGLPPEKLFSHQIVPSVNSSWNPQLFASSQSLDAGRPWRTGLNLYGGATDSDWVRAFLAERRARDYGVPEFHPQQWKRPGVALQALKSHQTGGARYVSPYYLSLVPDRFRSAAQHGVNAMELRPDNPADGSAAFYEAIQTLARQ